MPRSLATDTDGDDRCRQALLKEKTEHTIAATSRVLDAIFIPICIHLIQGPTSRAIRGTGIYSIGGNKRGRSE